MAPLPSPLFALRSNGMVTVVGNSTAQTTASWIAQTRRQRRIHLDGFADPFTIADCNTVTAGLGGVERLSSMLASAVTEALDNAEHLGPNPQAECLEILLVPQWLASEGCAQLSAMLSSWIAPYPVWSGRSRERMIIQAGATGAWLALEHAYRALGQNRRLQHVMIAAVDSACESAVLRHAADADWLLRPGNSQGYIPGEAAACVLLERIRNVTDISTDDFALHRPALVQAPARLWPGADQADASPLCKALSGALASSGMGATNISHLESEMDGSDWRARIESTALNRVIFTETSALPQWRPATLLGQVGTAGGVIAWLLPAMLHRQRIDRVNTVLNWSIEPTGEIAACVLERSPH
ncbi:hypothetical protein RBA41_33080 [Massilia sp. CCM 9210]|uniref:hypothetical protein n=1 Tax=Massilia scottii TaxID=3057166 RepID=UPI002796C7A6|nr:hypothetical protein [Massilia sp. CCM 9210]MDQ1818144.1 hypothetical protein [Massilia sp. CCM 9210]